MRRPVVLALVLAAVLGLVMATGMLRIRLQVEPGDWVSASPFWREEGGQGSDAPIQSPTDLTRRVAGTPPGTQAALRVARKDGEHTLPVKLGRLRDEPTSEDR